MRLPFELDPEIIHHIIHSQAGSIGKAVIELIMNSVDAGARQVVLTITREGFTCADDGQGFASREDVLRYFGRFGTPHQEGDATYGRFRLGRGQIMAHARTLWQSNSWAMRVDTLAMGYSYELDPLSEPLPGCHIDGTWYEALTSVELNSCLQEIRDLVRYTPVTVELNGQRITRDPSREKWDREDEFAYYRAKEEGPVGIYNQGVLVRNDSAHVWGVGGLIVSKKAISLNVSRTEILRKTCPVWKAINKAFTQLASTLTASQGEHRKTEARRAKNAHALLSGEGNLTSIAHIEEVITLLPGKRHVTLSDFINKAHRDHGGTYTVVQHGRDVPKGEAIGGQRFVQVLHPQTLQRFNCYSVEDFEEVLTRLVANVRQSAEEQGQKWFTGSVWLAPQAVAFATLKAAFIERTELVDEKQALDKETRRAWVALRSCFEHYVNAGRARRSPRMQVFLGASNTCDAWTDGKRYLALNVEIVKRLKSAPMVTATYLFSLVDHELAHEGDSLDCGHDEAFYQRFHDIVLGRAEERQRQLHRWLMKYTMSMEREGKKARGSAWGERYLVERVGSGRMKRGLSPAIEDMAADPIVLAEVPEPDRALMQSINAGFVQTGTCPPAPDWLKVRDQALLDQAARREEKKIEDERYRQINEDMERELQEQMITARGMVLRLLQVEEDQIPPRELEWLCEYWVHLGLSDQNARHIQSAWAEMASEPEDEPDWGPGYFGDDGTGFDDGDAHPEELQDQDDPCQHLAPEFHGQILTGETWWSLERNAAAAGFHRVEDYLTWRAAEAKQPDDEAAAAIEGASHG